MASAAASAAGASAAGAPPLTVVSIAGAAPEDPEWVAAHRMGYRISGKELAHQACIVSFNWFGTTIDIMFVRGALVKIDTGLASLGLAGRLGINEFGTRLRKITEHFYILEQDWTKAYRPPHSPAQENVAAGIFSLKAKFNLIHSALVTAYGNQDSLIENPFANIEGVPYLIYLVEIAWGYYYIRIKEMMQTMVNPMKTDGGVYIRRKSYRRKLKKTVRKHYR